MLAENEVSQASLAVDSARRVFIVTVASVQLISFVPLLAMSVYVVRVMCTTSILHLNLRFLFVWHALSGILFVVGESRGSALNVLYPHAPQFPFSDSLVDGFLARLGIVANIYVTPILVVERIMATRAVGSYERRRGGHYLLYSLMALVLLISVMAAVKDTHSHVYGEEVANGVACVVGALNIVIGVIAYMILLLVLRHNERLYKRDLHKRDGHNLSERYQRSENIRASRQLLPVLFLHVLQNVPPAIFIVQVFRGSIATQLDYATHASITVLLLGWFYLALQLSIIMSHPILKRHTMAQLRGCSWSIFTKQGLSSRISPVIYTSSNNNHAIEIIDQLEEGKRAVAVPYTLQTIDGRELIQRVEDLRAEHFKNLATYWETNGPTVNEAASICAASQHSTTTL